MTEKKRDEISYKVLMPYRDMLYQNSRAAKAYLKIAVDIYGAKSILNVAHFYGVYDLPIVNGEVV